MFCGYRHLSIDHGKRFSRGKVYINGIEGFWSFAKERLIKHHEYLPASFFITLRSRSGDIITKRDLHSCLNLF